MHRAHASVQTFIRSIPAFRMYLPSNMKKHMKIAKIIHYLFIIFVCFDEVISCLCTILTECTNKISDKNLNTIHVSVAMITF